MSEISLIIDGQTVGVPEGTTILEGARRAGIYIPVLCHHPDLPPAGSGKTADAIYQGDRKILNQRPGESGRECGLCLVEVGDEPELVRSCSTPVAAGMVVVTDSERIRAARRENLVPILAEHPHACLTCSQRHGCSRSQCSSNVPENERCCNRFGHCELQNVAEYIGISPETPKWLPTDFPVFDPGPFFVQDDNLCIGCTRCVRVCRDLRGVEALGFVYDERGRVRVGALAPSLEAAHCKFCTACVEVCPTGALADKGVRPGRKEADLVPCREACPAHIDVPAYLRRLAEGKRHAADAVIREKVPLPGVLGRVCVHPCEEVCRRGLLNEPIAICALKRYAADGDSGTWKEKIAVKPKTGRRVAVVGAGPAGLAAAFYSRIQGHDVTVFEARSRAGGMMRYGIPTHRLPRDVLDREIQDILDLGVNLRLGQAVGKALRFKDLLEDGYDAVFLGVGAQRSRRVHIEGADHPDVLWGVDFLGRVGGGEVVPMRGRVIVVGGGNVAVDAARTARRCGAADVTIVCLERREEMPAHEREIAGALAEGIRLMPCWGPQSVLRDGGRLTGVELARCVAVRDEAGHVCPVFEDVRQRIEGDQVIMAVGQATDLTFLEGVEGLSIEHGLIVASEGTLATGLERVYAGGDAVDGRGTVIHAIEAGRRAAVSMDRALGGGGVIDELFRERSAPEPYLGRDRGFSEWSRAEMAELPPEKRTSGFAEVALGLAPEQAVKEARRCLQCDLRLLMKGNPSPPERMTPFNAESVERVPAVEGVYQLYDGDRRTLAITGTPNLKESLLAALREAGCVEWFDFEEDKMYSKREAELLQQYLQAHGEMPGGIDSDLDDLF